MHKKSLLSIKTKLKSFSSLIEAVAELDEELMEKYLEGEEITIPELKAAIRKGTLNVEFYPVLVGSAFKNKGVQLVLDAVLDYLPAPTDVAAIKGTLPDTNEEVVRESTDDAPFAALAFKVMTDPYVGKLTFFRVYSGTLDSGSYVKNSSKNKRERVGRILQMHANSREEISTVYAGDIQQLLVLKIHLLVILFVTRKILLSLSLWNSQSQLSM